MFEKIRDIVIFSVFLLGLGIVPWLFIDTHAFLAIFFDSIPFTLAGQSVTAYMARISLSVYVVLFLVWFCCRLVGSRLVDSEMWFMSIVYSIGAPFAYVCYWFNPSHSQQVHLFLLSMGAAALTYRYWEPYFHFGDEPLRKRQRLQTEPASSDDSGREFPNIARTKIPKINFSAIFGNNELKDRLNEAAAAVIGQSGRKGSQPRNGILLFGEPGNGKTIFAEALAGEMKLPLLQLSFSDVASQWVGEKTARIRHVFDQARRDQPCVLFIDEVDSFLESRDESSGSATKEDRDMVNALLTLMVDLRDSRVILMAATNHMDRLDGAGIREGRFDFKVEITPPDAKARIGLLQKGVSENLSGYTMSDDVLETIARRWNGFSVKRILAITEEMPSYLKRSDKKGKSLEYEDFMGALRSVQGRRGAAPENVKLLSELMFSAKTREMLDLIVGRMADPEHTEMHGGTLPTGVLFYGPAGTGKTAACKAIAKEIDWAFLPSTGADLARDPEKLEKLYNKARELRPAIIFIDEADELLRSREYSQGTESTNKLLTLMDGVNDRVKDVVWIAATNYPDMIDPALLRGGRFTEKVEFEKPDADMLTKHLTAWLQSRKIRMESGLRLQAIIEMIGEESIANAEAVAQAALNRAVSRRQTPVVVTQADFEQAVSMVL